MDSITGTESDPVRLAREYTAGPDFAARITAASFRYAMLRPLGGILLSVLVVTLATLGFTVNDGTDAPAAAVVEGIIVLVASTAAIVESLELLASKLRAPST